jgi:translocation and assembly module TamB
LEESETVTKVSNSTSGQINFNMSLVGPILDPDVNLKIELSHLVMEEQDFPNSVAQISINKKGFEGTAQVLGQRLQSEFLIPFDKTNPMKLKMQAHDWNFATLGWRQHSSRISNSPIWCFGYQQ